MRKTLTTAAVLALGLLARAIMPAPAQADEYWPDYKDVCCGIYCQPDNYCKGFGSYKCCK
jgi:hypothetical protein